MIKGTICCISIILLCTTAGISQQQLAGKIFKKGTKELIPGVTVKNNTIYKYSRSDFGGNYRVLARQGDTILLSSAGYKADTVIVTETMLFSGFDILMAPNVVELPTVEVDDMSKYEADSVQRRKDYSFILDRIHPVKLVNEKRSGDAPGLNFSPVGYFSKNEKENRKLKKRLQEEDENAYIDAKFPRSRVALLTRLQGDSLQQFMLRYRPGYKFCRKAASQDILQYINEKLVLYKKGKSKTK